MILKASLLFVILSLAFAGQVNVMERGAKGDGLSDDTKAIQAVLDACSNGVDEAYFPSGTFMVWPLTLKSNARINISAGAKIKFFNNYSIFPKKDGGYQSLISADGATGIQIRGDGTIDGNGENWWSAEKAGKLKYSRPHFVSFHNCKNLQVTGIKLKKSPEKHLAAVNSQDVLFQNIIISTDSNTESTHGVNLVNSQRVTIDGLLISTGDEHIAIKGGCDSINVKNCMLGDGHGLTLGELYNTDQITNVVVNNITISGSRGIRIHTDYKWTGFISHIEFEEIIVHGGYATVEIDLTQNAPEGYWYGDPVAPGIGHMQFTHVRGFDVESPGHFICRRDRPCEQANLVDFKVYNPKWDGFKCMYISGQSEDVIPKFCY